MPALQLPSMTARVRVPEQALMQVQLLVQALVQALVQVLVSRHVEPAPAKAAQSPAWRLTRSAPWSSAQGLTVRCWVALDWVAHC